MTNFAMTGVAGYVAPRHLQAIKETGSTLVAAMDPNDSVGILDSYFPDTRFFTEFERFDRHIDKLRRQKIAEKVDWLSVCSPNYLHDAHIRFGLRNDANVICEKPLVINPWNLDAIDQLQQETGRTLNCILQLRLHPSLLALREKIQKSDKRHSVRLTYVTPRGQWYKHSWKGDEEKSGGVITNIGIHFFDMLIWLFGSVNKHQLSVLNQDKASGFLECENADVEWYLSVDRNDLARHDLPMKPYRSILVDGQEVEFSGGFRDLHTQSYEQALAGNGFGLQCARPSIELVHSVRQSQAGNVSSVHPWWLDHE